MRKQIFAFTLILLSPAILVGGGDGCRKRPERCVANPCNTPATKSAPVTLKFPTSLYIGRTHPIIPEIGSDPRNVLSGPTLATSWGSHFCVIRIKGIKCPNYEATYVWDVKSLTKNIPIPTHTDYNLTVDFYESCGYWDNNNNVNLHGRPYYTYAKYFTAYQSSYTISLSYSKTPNC